MCHSRSVLRRLIKHGLQLSVQGLTHGLVASGGQVKVIVHVLMRDAAAGMDKARIYTEERGVREGRYSLLHQLVHLGITLPQWVWHFTSRQQTLEDREDI